MRLADFVNEANTVRLMKKILEDFFPWSGLVIPVLENIFPTIARTVTPCLYKFTTVHTVIHLA